MPRIIHNRMLMRIGDLAERTNTTPQTLRYYEKLGLIVPTERHGHTHRLYDDAVVARLERIAVLKDLGLSLDEIAAVIDLYFEDATGIQGKRKVLTILRTHLHDVDAKMLALRRFRDELIRNIERLEQIIETIEGGNDTDV